MAKVKICGLTRAQDISAVNEYKPDFAGFVFAPSRRRLLPDDAGLLVKGLDAAILPVGIFVNETAQTVAEIAAACKLGAVQLHGAEDHGYLSVLRKLLPQGTLIIKAIQVKDGCSLEQAEGLHCDLLLLDAYAEDQPGGTGKAFDWRLLNGFHKPYLLAGGLHAGNIAEAISICNPFGVDASSGVETDGAKDKEKIGQFISLARRGYT